MTQNILVLSNDPFSSYETVGQTYMDKYFNPNDMFDNIFVIEPPSSLKSVQSHNMYEIYYTKRSGLKFLYPYDILKMYLKAFYVILNNDINLIRAYNPFFAGLIGVLLQKLFKTPCIISLHNDYKLNQKIEKRYYIFGIKLFSNLVEKYTISSAGGIIAMTNHLKNYAIAHGAKSENVQVIPNKVDISKFEKNENISYEPDTSFFNNSFVLLYVGSLVKQKDPLTLLKAFNNAKKQLTNLKLILIGDGPLKPDIEQFIQEYDLYDDVLLKGYMSHDALPSFMANSDVFVFPTLEEGFGIVLIEAQAAGLPIISSEIPQTKDIITHKNALLFKPGDANMLTNYIMEIYRDGNLRKHLSKKSKESAERFSWDKIADQETELYQAYINSH